MGVALATSMKLDEARLVLNAARTLVEEAGDTAELALVHHALARAQGMDARARVPHYARALDLWPADREDDTLLQLVLGMAEALGPGIGNFEAAAPYFKRAALLAEHVGSTRARFNIVYQETMARFEQGTPASAMLSLLDQGDAVVQSAGELSAQALFVWFRGFTHFTAGNLREAGAQFARVVNLAGERVMPNEHAQGVREGARVALLMGDWHAAKRLFAAAIALQPIALHEQQYCWASGDHEGTLAAGRRGMADLKEQQSIKYLIGTLSYLAESYLQLGRPREAEQHSRDAWELARSHALWMHGPLLHGPLVEAAALLQTADAEAMLTEAEQAATNYEPFLGRPPLLRARGLLLAAEDKPAAALTVLRESAAVALEQHAAVQLARTLVVLEDVARAAGSKPTARAAEVERRAIVERIGPAAHDLVWTR